MPRSENPRMWSLLDDARILTLLRKGWTRKQIAADFGVTKNAICGRVHRLGYKDPDVSLAIPDDETIEVSFDDAVAAEPVFEPPVQSFTLPPWYIGQRVFVDFARAWSRETDFVDWKGEGEIDMISHGGAYIRVASGEYVAWISDKHFGGVRPITPPT